MRFNYESYQKLFPKQEAPEIIETAVPGFTPTADAIREEQEQQAPRTPETAPVGHDTPPTLPQPEPIAESTPKEGEKDGASDSD